MPRSSRSPAAAGDLVHGGKHAHTFGDTLPLSKSAVRLRPLNIGRSDTPVTYRPCLPPSPKREQTKPPESSGRIVLLGSGKLGALSPRDADTGKRRPLGAYGSYAAANERLVGFRAARAVVAFLARLAGIGGAS